MLRPSPWPSNDYYYYYLKVKHLFKIHIVHYNIQGMIIWVQPHCHVIVIVIHRTLHGAMQFKLYNYQAWAQYSASGQLRMTCWLALPILNISKNRQPPTHPTLVLPLRDPIYDETFNDRGEGEGFINENMFYWLFSRGIFFLAENK